MYLMAAVPTYDTGSKYGCVGRGGDAGVECRSSVSTRNGGGAPCGGALVSFNLLEIDENDNSFPWGLIHHNELAHMLNSGLGKTMVIDSRSFLEYNTSTIQQSVNVCCSKLVKRRLQQDKVQVLDLLNQTCNIGADASWDVIVYDQCTEDPSQLTSDNFVQVLLHKLSTTFNSVAFLKGGFLAFQASHPCLVESKSSSHRCSTLTSLSQPCMPVSNVGPTRILPFLYLGSQQDSINQEVAQVNGISYILNVSKTCPRPPFILEGHFHRIPVNDNYCEKLLPYFQEAFQFLDKVREANGCVLVHCLGGVSRSATLAIAYIMRYMRMSSDEAYRYVKDKRPTISPNFNFLGQLLEYEKVLKEEQEEEARRKALRASLEEEGGEVDRGNPCRMDLLTTTTSPSSPAPHHSFPPTPASIKFSIASQVCPFPGPANSDTCLVSRPPAVQSAVSQPHKMACDSLPLPRPSSESCPFPGPSPEMGSLPGPSYENQLYLPAVCFNAAHCKPLANVTSTATHICHEHSTCNQVMTPFCDNNRVGWDLQPVTQSPVCPVTGFPSPWVAYQDFPQPTCPKTGFPGPRGHCGSSDSQTTGQTLRSVSGHGTESGHVTKTQTETETLCKNTATYHNHIESSKDFSTDYMLPIIQSDLALKNAQKEPAKRSGFSLSSVLSSLRWKSRPPTLPLGSPVGPPKEGGRYMKKHAGETSGTGDSRVQLTPVSEAVENGDLNSLDDCAASYKSTTTKTETVEPDIFNSVLNVSNNSGSSLSNATTLAMASSNIDISPASTVSSVSHVHTSNPVFTSILDPSPTISTKMYRSAHLRLKAKGFTLSLSSPTTDYQGALSSSFAPLSLPSPGDSNKRKSFLPSSSDSPDKLAKTDESHHHHPYPLTPPRTLNLYQGPVGKLRQKFSKKSFLLPISSPTAAMARLNVASPAETSADFSSLAADSGGGGHGATCDSSSPRFESDEYSDLDFGLKGAQCKEKSGTKCAQTRLFPLDSHAVAVYSSLPHASHDPAEYSSLPQGRLFSENHTSCRHNVFSNHSSDTLHVEANKNHEALSWSHKGNNPDPGTTICMRKWHSKCGNHSSVFCCGSRSPLGQTKWKSTSSLTVATSNAVTSKDVEETSLSHKTDSFQKQQSDTSVFASLVESSSSVSTMSLSSSSFLSKSCTSIATSSLFSSSVREISSSNISCSTNLQGFSQFPTTSLDKLSFTPCYTKDIVQELKSQESPRHGPVDHSSSADGSMGPSALDSPMSISSGSSAPSIASSTLSPVESSMTNPFSEASTYNAYDKGDSSTAFLFSQPQTPSPSDSATARTFDPLPGTPEAVLSPSSTSEFILSPLSMPQATLAPVIPTLSSLYYCSSSCMEPLSPMSVSDSSSSSPLRSPTTHSIMSPLPSSVSSPVSSLSSPVMPSPYYSPLVTSPVSSSSHIAGATSSLLSSINTKVILRRDKNKRVLDRPNSIAFSSYPTCDLVPNSIGSSDSGPGGHVSSDDASEAYMTGIIKRSRLNISTESPHGRTLWGGYSEREVYKQITAAMESAMLRTQALTPSPLRRGRLAPAPVSSRKARSLDDILDSTADEDEFMASSGEGNRPWNGYTDQTLFDQYSCGMRSGSEPYHSSSSLSSNGSHGSSLEIIQVS